MGGTTLPKADEITPIARLLARHIDTLEQELAAARAQRDQALRHVNDRLSQPRPWMLAVEEPAPIDAADSPETLDVSCILPVTTAARGNEPSCVTPVPNIQKGSLQAGTRKFITTARYRLLLYRTRKDWGHLLPRLRGGIDRHHGAILLGIAAALFVVGAARILTRTLLTDVNASLSEMTVPLVGLPSPQSQLAREPLNLLPEEPNPQMTASVLEAEQSAARTQSPHNATAAAHIEATQATMIDGVSEPEQVRQQVRKIPRITSVGSIPTKVGPADLRRAATLGEPGAVYEFASRAADGRTMTRDLPLAARLFENAAAHGLVPAQYRIATMYERGLGVRRDVVLAKAWYLRAAEQGNVRAMHRLGMIAAEGFIGKPDHAIGIQWLKRAARYGNGESQLKLAQLLASTSTNSDLPAAYLWFAIVSSTGHDEAAKKRDEIQTLLTPDQLLAAKRDLETWRPERPDKFANDPPEWDPSAAHAPNSQPKRHHLL